MTANGWAPDGLAIDRKSVVPIYRQLYERLREQILTGALPEGTRLPPERALAGRLGVNRSTVVHGYRELVAVHKGEATAEITVAETLKDDHVAALKRALKAISGKDVDLDIKVDPAIIGGLVVKLGSRMVDTSLRTKLNAIRHAMKEAR